LYIFFEGNRRGTPLLKFIGKKNNRDKKEKEKEKKRRKKRK